MRIRGIRQVNQILTNMKPECNRNVSCSRTVRTRVWTGLSRLQNWMQLGRFAAVGSAGYALNLACFYVAVGLLGFDHLIGAIAAFAMAVTNNFMWNRHWTFEANSGNRRRQAIRFLAVSCAGFTFATTLLDLLIGAVDMAPVTAQAISVAVAMPLTFMGNKLWTFDSETTSAIECRIHVSD
jgi:putative flippase GtrA